MKCIVFVLWSRFQDGASNHFHKVNFNMSFKKIKQCEILYIIRYTNDES
jgi:hypothetical protein